MPLPTCLRPVLPRLCLLAGLAGLGGVAGWSVWAAPGGGQQAGQPTDQARALAARGRGEILPLDQILALVERLLPGRVVEIELEHKKGGAVYELEWLLPDGRVLELKIDARNGEWLELEGRQLETVFRRPAQPTRSSGGVR